MKLSAERRSLLERRTGGLSRPSKLPGWSYNLPAGRHCHTGRTLLNVQNSACGNCYARRGHFMFPNVVEAQYKRLEAVQFSTTWVDDMVELIGSKKETFFCWHDSGDLQSINHLQKIVRIAERLANYRFWLPTLEYRFIQAYRSMTKGFPPNLTVRLSTPIIDQPRMATDECTSSVVSANASCPALRQGNSCGNCRDCWDPRITHVTYQQH
jgi:hypothetical protein